MYSKASHGGAWSTMHMCRRVTPPYGFIAPPTSSTIVVERMLTYYPVVHPTYLGPRDFSRHVNIDFSRAVHLNFNSWPCLEDISRLRGCSRLQTLELYSTEVYDLSPLLTCPALSVLSVHLQSVGMLLQLQHLTQLTSLEVAYSEPMTYRIGLGTLTNLRKLKMLIVDTDLQWLENLSDLKVLDMPSGRYKNVEWARSLKHLEELTADDSDISDIEPLSVCTELRYLSLQQPDVWSLSPLVTCKNLHTLKIDFTRVSNLAPLSVMPNLCKLTAKKTFVQDVTPLSACTKLAFIDLSYTQVYSANALSACTNLVHLNLNHTFVTEVRALSVCKGLSGIIADDWFSIPLGRYHARFP